MSLSSWFRDYVYIPLGGNRKETIILVRNIFYSLGSNRNLAWCKLDFRNMGINVWNNAYNRKITFDKTFRENAFDFTKDLCFIYSNDKFL